MSDGQEAKSLLGSAIADLNKSARESAKGKLKDLLGKRADAKKVVSGIEDQIVELLVSVGETEADVRAMIAGA
jgi:hypothetical protein